MTLYTTADDEETGAPASTHSNEQEGEGIHEPQHAKASSLPTPTVEEDKGEMICQEQAPRVLSQQKEKHCCAWARFDGVSEAQVCFLSLRSASARRFIVHPVELVPSTVRSL